MYRKILQEDMKTDEEQSMITRLLLMLLCLGVLNTISGCYLEPTAPTPVTYENPGVVTTREPYEGGERWTEEERRAYWRQRRQERARERAYRDWEREREDRPDWLR
jgi:hypothetical protein